MSAKPLILAVDDEPDILQLIKRILEPVGYDVITLVGSSQAMNLVAEKNPDLVLLDIKMPGKSGLEVLQELRTSHADTAVIMATGVGDVTVAVGAMRKGASDYINKPFHVDELIISVERALERRKLILENRDYQLNLEEKVAEQTQLLELKVRELTGLNNLCVTYLNQGFEAAESYNRFASNIIKMAEEIKSLAKEAEARKVEVQSPDAEEEGNR